ncbi:DUF2298 domain-containing protein [Kallotenue papyrolyticum]|uniref:DUF2298 domain-containing protein n=1 Tax=Kallotenue papyrolyticum TaxID=1325125 RepID=UPI00047867A9|nr:DUF2298 domain-containing protein [Kallotenue papyrolyticum]
MTRIWSSALARLRQPPNGLVSALLLALILVWGGALRAINLSAWDGSTGHHPDERFLHYTVVTLSLPAHWRDYFVSVCPDPLPFPRNPNDAPERWEPSALSGCSTLNPRNFNWSRNFVYGTLPTTLTRLTVDLLGRTEIHQIVVTGRALSLAGDLLALLATFGLGCLVYDRRVGLLAAALYAGAVMPIQQSHFFTVDNFAVGFGALALLFTTRLALGGGWLNALLSGIFTAAATASKINMAALAGMIFVAAAQQAWRSVRSGEASWPRALARAALLLIIAGSASALAFRIFQPDAFQGPRFWNIAPEARFLEMLAQARLTANGTIDLPSSHQWAARTPWLYPWRNMVLWGMGLPLGLAATLGWLAAGWHLRHTRRHLIPWLWSGAYFAWQGQQFTMTMRYFLPIYGPLIMFAAWALLALLGWSLRHRRARIYPDRLWRLRRWQRPALAATLLAGVALSTWSWAWAYTRIYTRPYTRVAAAQWIERAAPNGAVTTWELWDDPLPLPPAYEQMTTHPYAEEEPGKYLGRPGSDEPGLIAALARAEYVVLTSPRVYGSVDRVPQRYPITLRYYRALFDGTLGYQLVADIHSFPSLFGLPINDLGADEAFWVYDHPRVLIFRRTADFSAERARALLTGDVAWSEIYRGLRPAQVSAAPTALQLPARVWERLQAEHGGALLSVAPPLLGGLLWLVALEALGLATAGLLWRLRLPLADRGLSLARPLGLLLFGSLPGLLAALGIATGRPLLALWYGLLLGLGGAILWRERAALRGFVRERLLLLAWPQAIYLLLLVLGLLLPMANAPEAERHLARWAALTRTPLLPPYDPGFAGGLDPTPYAGRLSLAWLSRWLGLPATFSLNLALATALALLGLTLATALRTGLPRRTTAGTLTLGLLLVFGAGLPLGALRELGLWSALAHADLDALSLGWLTGLILALAAPLLRPRPSDARGWWRWLLPLTLTLAAIAGYGLPALLGAWSVVALALVRGPGPRRRWPIAGVALGGALLLGHSWSWHLAAPAAAMGLSISARELLIGLLAPLLLLAAAGAWSAPRLAGGTTALITGGLVGAWSALAVLLGWSGALLSVPALVTLVWLALQSWLLPHGAAQRRVGVLCWSGAVALAWISLASLPQWLPTAAGARSWMVAGGVLLAGTAGWSLPLLSAAGRALRHDNASLRELPRLAAGALLLLALGGALLALPASAATQPDPAISAAGRWLAQHTAGTPLIAAAPASAAHLTGLTGLPVLLDDAPAQARLRAMVAPAVESVIAGRQQALQTLYGGDTHQAQETLRRFHISLVVVGPAERELYGANTGSALDALARQGALERVYHHNGVTIYQATPPDGPPPFVTPPRLTAPSTKTLLLDRPVQELPPVNEYNWNALAQHHPWLGVLLWLLLLEGLGLLAWPLTRVLFARWPDQGWGLSKLIGLLLWGYLVWLPVSLGWWSFTRRALLIAALLLAAGALLALRRRTWAPLSRRALLIAEACFVLAFGLWSWVRAANPDLWHPFFGGEKPFEFGLLNALLRSPVLPPYDPFFSGGIVNYYYYGLFLMALPIKATGVPAAVGFNLAVATLFALMAAATLALGQAISGRQRYGWIALALMLGMGPPATAVAVNESRGLGVAFQALSTGWQGLGARLNWWFWGPSRVVPNTINEFPLWGFLFADLHPHLIALPITLLAIAIAFELLRAGPRRGLLALGALTLGALAIANSWDAPTYALLLGGALTGHAWRTGREGGRRGRWPIVRAALMGLGLLLAALLLYLPFLLHYRAMVRGLGLARTGETIQQYALLYGPFLYIAITLLGGLVWAVAYRARAPWRMLARAATLAVPLLIMAVLLSGGRPEASESAAAGWSLRLLLALLAGTGVVLLLIARLRAQDWFPLWLITTALLVALGIQFIFVRDHLAGSPAERMNTVFKFGEQIWVLLALGTATALPLIGRLLRPFWPAAPCWYAVLALLLAPGLCFPVFGIPSRLATRFDTSLPLTLDGLAFMRRARYDLDGHPIELRHDAEAIAWLNQHISGTPVLATSEAEFYRTYGMRVAANTGLPTVLGRLHQDEQRPAGPVLERERDIQQLFATPDAEFALGLLAKYDVDYVYVGPLERLLYGPQGLDKWQQLDGTVLQRVFQNEGVTIYRVDRAARRAYDRPMPPAPTDDLQPVAPEQIVAATGDAATAFGLAQELLAREQPEAAARVLQAAAAQHPNDVPLHHLLGDVLAQLGRAEEAIAAWQQAATVSPSAPNINKLGQGLTQLGRYAAAEQTLQRALALDPTFADPYFYLGELYRLRDGEGDRQRAHENYQRYLEQASADAPLREMAAQRLRELGP